MEAAFLPLRHWRHPFIYGRSAGASASATVPLLSIA